MTADGPAPPPRLARVTGQKYLEALDVLGFGVSLMDSEFRFLDTSRRFCDLIGRTIDELRELPDPASIVVPERRHMVADRRRSMAEGGLDPRLDEVALIHRDGSHIPVEFSSTPIALADGTTGLLAICRDLRGRRARDEIVTQYTALAESMPVGLLFWDASGVNDPFELRLLAVNAGAERLVDRSFAGCVGQTMGEIFPTTKPSDAARLLALAGTDRVEHFADVANVGVVLRWQAVGLPGPAVGVFFEDVTEERVAERDRRHLLERLVDTGDDERRRLAIAMHDDPVQKLAAATLLVEALRRHPDAGERDERMEAVEATLRSAMTTMRRLTFELSPPELAESGLEAAVRSAANYVFDGVAVELVVTADFAQEPAAPVQTAAFRIVTEALTNARKHAEATRVSVSMNDGGGRLALVVTDDGKGFDPAAADELGHLGIRTMQERAATLGGRCQVVSTASGVTVSVELPSDAREPQPSTSPVLLPTTDPGAHELGALRQERDSLRKALEDALRRAHLAEGRLHDAFGITKAILVPELSQHDIAVVAAEHLGRALHGGCSLHLSHEGPALRRLEASWRLDDDQVRDIEERVVGDGDDFGHLGTAWRSGMPVLLDREALLRPTGSPAGPPLHSVIVAPLVVDEAVVGAVTVVRDRTLVPFDVDDLDFLMCLVDRVGIALTSAPPAGG